MDKKIHVPQKRVCVVYGKTQSQITTYLKQKYPKKTISVNGKKNANKTNLLLFYMLKNLGDERSLDQLASMLMEQPLGKKQKIYIGIVTFYCEQTIKLSVWLQYLKKVTILSEVISHIELREIEFFWTHWLLRTNFFPREFRVRDIYEVFGEYEKNHTDLIFGSIFDDPQWNDHLQQLLNTNKNPLYQENNIMEDETEDQNTDSSSSFFDIIHWNLPESSIDVTPQEKNTYTIKIPQDIFNHLDIIPNLRDLACHEYYIYQTVKKRKCQFWMEYLLDLMVFWNYVGFHKVIFARTRTNHSKFYMIGVKNGSFVWKMLRGEATEFYRLKDRFDCSPEYWECICHKQIEIFSY